MTRSSACSPFFPRILDKLRTHVFPPRSCWISAGVFPLEHLCELSIPVPLFFNENFLLEVPAKRPPFPPPYPLNFFAVPCSLRTLLTVAGTSLFLQPFRSVLPPSHRPTCFFSSIAEFGGPSAILFTLLLCFFYLSCTILVCFSLKCLHSPSPFSLLLLVPDRPKEFSPPFLFENACFSAISPTNSIVFHGESFPDPSFQVNTDSLFHSLGVFISQILSSISSWTRATQTLPRLDSSLSPFHPFSLLPFSSRGNHVSHCSS